MFKILFLVVTLVAWPAWANKSVKILVPFAPGSATDLMARTVSDPLSRQLGVPVVVENRPGAGGNIANREVATADSKTVVLLVNGVGIASNAALDNSEYDFTGLVPLAKLGSLPVIFVSSKKSNIRTVQDLARHDSITYGSSGGGLSYLYGQLVAHETKRNFIHVPYKGVHQSLPDLASGQLDSAFLFYSNAMSYINADKIYPVAVGTTYRLSGLESVPTMQELGIRGTENIDSWFAVFSNNTEQTQQLEQIRLALSQVLDNPATKQKLVALGIELPKTHKLRRDFLIEEYKRYQVIVKKIQAKRLDQ